MIDRNPLSYYDQMIGICSAPTDNPGFRKIVVSMILRMPFSEEFSFENRFEHYCDGQLFYQYYLHFGQNVQESLGSLYNSLSTYSSGTPCLLEIIFVSDSKLIDMMAKKIKFVIPKIPQITYNESGDPHSSALISRWDNLKDGGHKGMLECAFDNIILFAEVLSSLDIVSKGSIAQGVHDFLYINKISGNHTGRISE